MKTKSLLFVLIAFFMMQYTSASTTDNGSGVKLDGGIWYTTWVQITDGDGHNTQKDKNNLDINLSYPSNKVDFQFKTGGTTTNANRKMYLDIYTGSWVENHYTATVSKDKTFYDFSSSLPTNATAIAFRSFDGSSKRFVRNIKVHMAPHTKMNTSSIAFTNVPVGTTATQTIDFYSFLSGSNGIQISVVNGSKQVITIPGLSLNHTSIGKNECEKINENAYSITVTFKPQSFISYSNCYIRITNSGASIGGTIDIPITSLSSSLSAPTLSLQSNGTGYEVVHLQWNAITGANGYNIYDNGTKVGTYTGTTAAIAGLAMGSSHNFTVTTLAGTSESNHSNTINVTTNTYPKTSSVTFSNIQQNQFTINYNKVNITAKDHKFNRYQIHIYYYDYYGNWTHFQNIYITDNNQTSYTVTGVDDATKYDVYVGVDFQYTANGSTKSFDVASIGTQWVNNNVTTPSFIGSQFDGVQIYKGEWHRIEAGISHEMGVGEGCEIKLKEYPCENLKYSAWVGEEGNVKHYISEDATNIKYTLCGDGTTYLEGNKFQTPIMSIKPEYTNIKFQSSRGLFGGQKVYVSDMYAKIAPHIKIKSNAYINAQYPYIPLGNIRLDGNAVSATINFQSFLVFNELKVTSSNPKFKLSKSVIAPATTSKAGTFCQQGETKYDFTITFTPDELGSHNSRITITDGVNSIAFTVDATVYSKNRLYVAGDWNNSSNWFFGVPASTEDIEIAAAVTIPNGYTAIANNISIESGGSISITPQGKLKANNIIGANTSNLTLQADESGTATLLFKNSDKIGATVQLYSLASSDGLRNGTPGNFKDPKWQYLGVNVESVDYNTLNPDGKTNWIYRWDETQHSTSCWAEKLKTGSNLSAWTGYAFAQEKDTTYTYSGTLLNGDHTYNLTYTSDTEATDDLGNNLITNSYTAPIDITTLNNSNFEGAIANIVIYNTGSYVEWKNQTEIKGFGPGQVIEIPVNTVNYLSADYPRTIASSQGFFVKADEIGGGKFIVNYDKNVYNATQTGNIKRAKNNSKDFENVLCITVASSTSTDQLHLLEHNATTPEFDNGYDAKKHFDNPSGMQIYATTAFGYASINTDSTFDGQHIGFVADSEYELYTMTFDTEQIYTYEKLYLYDSMTETYVDLLTEEIYQFYGSVEPMDNRFIITGERKNAASDNTTTSVESVTWDDIVAMNETIYLYSTTGQLISTLSANSLYDLSIPAGVYIVRCGDKTLKIVTR